MQRGLRFIITLLLTCLSEGTVHTATDVQISEQAGMSNVELYCVQQILEKCAYEETLCSSRL